MHTESVEIYSDATNAAVMRHPGRHFPGLLVQGDTLYLLCSRADAACKRAHGRLSAEAYGELNDLRNQLRHYLTHYKNVLAEHGIRLPFSESPGE